MDLGISGLASGFDWRSLVDQLTAVEQQPETRLRNDQSKLRQQSSAYSNIQTLLNTLSGNLDTLKSTSLFDGRAATVGDSTIASASAATGAATGAYTFNITQLATASVQNGTSDVGKALNSTNDVSALVLSSAGFTTPVTAGNFTVNGKIVTITTSDTLQGVFDKISTATSGAVTGSYSAASDEITLSSGSAITLGSAADTSNFLTVAKLYNNGTGTVTSSSALGGIKLSSALSSANFTTTVSDGGSGSGSFKVNGVSISFNASSDSVTNILSRINDSTAGVIATYDSVNDRFVLTNKTTGDVGVALQDVTGNFLAASGLSGGALARGKNAQFTVNSGGTLNSQSNTITGNISGITGLTVTALDTGSTTVTVATDTATIKNSITSFVSAYNSVQSFIESQTAITVDASGKVTAGLLASDHDASDLSFALRDKLAAKLSGLSGTISKLADLGYTTSGTTNTVTLTTSTQLDTALANNLSGVKDFFTNSTSGLGTTLSTYVTGLLNTDTGIVVVKQNDLTKSASKIDTQIADMERLVQANRQRLIDSFVAMEQAQAQVNQQLSFLQQRLGIPTSSSGK